MARLHLVCLSLLLAFFTAPSPLAVRGPWASKLATSGMAGNEDLLVWLPATENIARGMDEQPPAPIRCRLSGCLHPPVRRRVPVAASVPLRRTLLGFRGFKHLIVSLGRGEACVKGRQRTELRPGDIKTTQWVAFLGCPFLEQSSRHLSPPPPKPCFPTMQSVSGRPQQRTKDLCLLSKAQTVLSSQVISSCVQVKIHSVCPQAQGILASAPCLPFPPSIFPDALSPILS